MSITIHNPDRYMADLRTIVGQGRKRIGLLVGSGAPAAVKIGTDNHPLIPTVDALTQHVLSKLIGEYAVQLDAINEKLSNPNIEAILSRVRALASVIGDGSINGLDGPGYELLASRICGEIGSTVNVRLPAGENAFRHLVNWISGTDRDHPVEIFTTNYDVLLEEAFESSRSAYFDGFSGSVSRFFDPVSVASNDLPSRWTRLWKLHGSLGWKSENGQVTHTGDPTSTHLIFPEHLKYDQTQKAPYSALFDRLRSFLSTPDTLLIATGFSFADAHISARIDECLAANPSASVFAFQFRPISDEKFASAIATNRPNFSVFARDKAIINGVIGDWTPGDPLSRDWDPIRATYWESKPESSSFVLGDFTKLARFLALSKTAQAHEQAKPTVEKPEDQTT